ncbi:hypothetical protein C7T36_18520 [Rhodococcus sp. AD45-ID]|uniref:hypothetical protein n=1 Tax=unclassified Rhodococcus (in: high G+C Gram-positive bacteria) TaxID=192944 RepID=UPI0005DE7B47|nr:MULTISPECIES: hypothetical protein [unclassified Rhodococcus (in: high G+C Gram-positive bacteria)]KJF21979.1 hypothetical protein SZ00_02623 [Rhodococcus sp. AD45]PSR39673.1 hypothetical protein C7T36_18520 [Rhodococcus sp. AD45-ID]
MSAAFEWPVQSSAKEWGEASAADKEAMGELATSNLWALTGRVFGLREVTVRPCFSPTDYSTYRGRSGADWFPGLVSGSWMPGSCGCVDGCNHPSEVALPGPVHSIVSVTVDGDTLDPSAYRIRNSRWLIRIDGGVWPQNQNLAVADDAEGAFTVTYKQGIEVPLAGQLAAGDLAVEFLRARKGGRCKMPDRAQHVARQGVDIQLVDAAVLFEQGLTGVSSVDQWIAACNPHKLRSRSRVHSVDAPRVARFR